MAYQVLARKYRPQRFSDVAGQEHVTRTLMNALEQGRIAHGYIFSGHRGIGKTTIARILGMALNCRTPIGSTERPTPEPCGICPSCQEIRAGNSVDMLEIDAATNRGIDEIRELRDAARYSPARDRYKIYLLDEAHQITDAAFNALLKTLEEPPDHVVFMMATTQPEDIPQTIRSRCQHFSFHAVKFDDILVQLHEIATQEGISGEDGAFALLAEAGDGSMRDALSIMDQAIASAPRSGAEGQTRLEAEQIRALMGTVPNTVFEKLLEEIHQNQSAAVMEQINLLINAGNSPSQLARQLVRYLRNSLMAKLGGEATELLQISADERARAARSANLFSEEDLTRFLQVMLRTFDELNYRQEQRFHLELGLLKLVHLQRLLPIEQILSGLPGASRTVSTAGAVPSASGRGFSGGVIAQTGLVQRPSGVPRPPAKQSETTPSIDSSARFFSGPATAAIPRIEIAAQPLRAPATGEQPRSEAVARPAAVIATIPLPQTETLAVPLSSVETAPPVEVLERLEEVDQLVGAQSIDSVAPVKRSSDPLGSERTVATEEPVCPTSAEWQHETDSRTTLPSEAGENALDLDAARDAIVDALDANGHNTAAELLSAARWSTIDGQIQAEVGIKKTMLGLTMNPEARKISQEALRTRGISAKLSIIPGEGLGASAAIKRAPLTGSIQELALENPLVRQAQELFRAEVRTVLDLRENAKENSRSKQ